MTRLFERLGRALLPPLPPPGSEHARALETHTRHALGMLGLVGLVQPLAVLLSVGALYGLDRLGGLPSRPPPAVTPGIVPVLTSYWLVGLGLIGASRTERAGRAGATWLAVSLCGMMFGLAWLEVPFRVDGGPSILPFVLLFASTIMPYRPLVAGGVSVAGGVVYLLTTRFGPLERAVSEAERTLVFQTTLPFVFALAATTLVVSWRVYAAREAAILDRIERDTLSERNRRQAEDLAAANRELLDAQNELVRRRHLAVLGNLVAGVSHELNNPTGALTSAVDVIGRAVDRLEEPLDEARRTRALRAIRDAYGSAVDATRRIEQVVRSLGLFARLDEAVEQRVEVSECVEAAIEVLKSRLAGVRLERDYADGPAVLCRPAHLNEVFRDLLLNAVEATGPAGRVRLRTSFENGEARVAVEDDGPGVPPERRDAIFEPGFTTKATGVGTGLGLATTLRLVEEQGGRIEVGEAELGGAEFTVVLPLDPEASPTWEPDL